MEISVSIEPFLGANISLLTQYIEKIVEIKQTMPGLSLHFDYFKPNLAALAVVRHYAPKIDVYAHLMHQQIAADGFKVVSRDVTEIPTPADYQGGLVFDLGSDLTGYEDLVKRTKYITIMSVKCGQSGQAFNPAALDLVGKVRALNPHAVITIDGGVNDTNINKVRAAGVDLVVVGSYAKKCYENGDLAAGLNRLLRP